MTNSFDYQEILNHWDVNLEQQKANFLEHMYNVYRPSSHTYTGLWKRFCITEAGPLVRTQFLEALKADKVYDKFIKSKIILRKMKGYGLPNSLRVTIGNNKENNLFLKNLNKIFNV